MPRTPDADLDLIYDAGDADLHAGRWEDLDQACLLGLGAPEEERLALLAITLPARGLLPHRHLLAAGMAAGLTRGLL